MKKNTPRNGIAVALNGAHRANHPNQLVIRDRFSESKFRFQKLIDGSRVGFAASAFHDLTGKPAEHRGLVPRLRSLVRIRGDDRIDRGCDRARVGDLRHATGLDYGARIAILVLGNDNRQHILGDLA